MLDFYLHDSGLSVTNKFIVPFLSFSFSVFISSSFLSSLFFEFLMTRTEVRHNYRIVSHFCAVCMFVHVRCLLRRCVSSLVGSLSVPSLSLDTSKLIILFYYLFGQRCIQLHLTIQGVLLVFSQFPQAVVHISSVATLECN